MSITLDGRTATPGATTEEQNATITAALEREGDGYALRQRAATEQLEHATDPVQRARLQVELDRTTRMAGEVAAELTRLRGGAETRPRRAAQNRQG